MQVDESEFYYYDDEYRKTRFQMNDVCLSFLNEIELSAQDGNGNLYCIIIIIIIKINPNVCVCVHNNFPIDYWIFVGAVTFEGTRKWWQSTAKMYYIHIIIYCV